MSEERLRALMIAAMAGDARAYQALLSASADRLRAYFRRRLRNGDEDVEDLVQETLVAIHRKRASYSPALPYTAWLHGIARYRLIDHLRREGRRPTVPIDDDLDLPVESGEASILASVDVERLLGELPGKQSTAIRLTRIEGFSTREAADRSGQSQPAIKTNVRRGLGRLMAKLGGQ